MKQANIVHFAPDLALADWNLQSFVGGTRRSVPILFFILLQRISLWGTVSCFLPCQSSRKPLVKRTLLNTSFSQHAFVNGASELQFFGIPFCQKDFLSQTVFYKQPSTFAQFTFRLSFIKTAIRRLYGQIAWKYFLYRSGCLADCDLVVLLWPFPGF